VQPPDEVREVGSIDQLWRYPVKSLQGEQVHEAALSADGVEGDRRYAVCAADTGRLLSAKTVPELLLASARTEGSDVVLSLPDSDELAADDPRVDAALTTWLGRPVALRERQSVGASSYEMTFDPPNDDAELVEIPTMPTRLFDLATLHVLTSSSLERLEVTAPGHQWDVRRFRPNLFVRSEVEEDDGFVEERWVDGTVAVGSATLLIQMRTVRCAMPLREQPGLARDLGIYRALDESCSNHLGVYVEVVSAGRVSVGDSLTLRVA
jgi:uncharacterized protein YcbX